MLTRREMWDRLPGRAGAPGGPAVDLLIIGGGIVGTGIARDASVADIQIAHDRIARELAPDAIDPALVSELGEKLDAIREVVGEALRVLRDEDLRPRYSKHLS